MRFIILSIEGRSGVLLSGLYNDNCQLRETYLQPENENILKIFCILSSANFPQSARPESLSPSLLPPARLTLVWLATLTGERAAYRPAAARGKLISYTITTSTSIIGSISFNYYLYLHSPSSDGTLESRDCVECRGF